MPPLSIHDAVVAAAWWLWLYGLGPHPFDPASPVNPFRGFIA